MYLTHPDYGVRKLSRYGDTSWTLTEVAFAKPVFLAENISDTTITPDATKGTGVTLTATKDIFESDHVGSYWQISNLRRKGGVELSINTTGQLTSDEISIIGGWELETKSFPGFHWDGSLRVQRSLDGGTTWETYAEFAVNSDRHIDYDSKQLPSRALFRIDVTCTAVGTGAGAEVIAYLRPTDNIVNGLVKVTAVPTSKTATVDVIDNLVEYADWVTATAYKIGDAVSNGNENYICTTAHTSAAGDEPGVGGSWATYWDLDMATSYWSEGAWSDVRGYPQAVALYEERLCFAGSSYQPQTIWGSQLDDYENFRMGTDDDDAYAYTLAAQEFNEIEWMVPTGQLIIGTSGGEWTLSSGDSSKTVTPTNVSVKRGSAYGSCSVAARQVYESVIFVQRQCRTVREQVYDFSQDARIATDVTLLADHVTAGGITQMDFQQQPDAIVWAVTGNGKLIGMTYERDAQVVGWHVHEAAGTDASIESVAVIYSSGNDEVWVTVKRTINGGTKRYVERLNPVDWSDKEDAFYVDSGITYDSTATTTISGLSHLEGETVKVFADGAVQDDKTVSSGQITIDSASVVQVGLGFTSTLKPMRLDSDPSMGFTQGKIKQIREIRARLYNSLGFTVYDGRVNRKETTYSALFTGEKEVEIHTDFEDDPVLEISTDDPIPLTLLGLVVKYKVTGK